MHNLRVQAGGQLSSELFKDHEPKEIQTHCLGIGHCHLGHGEKCANPQHCVVVAAVVIIVVVCETWFCGHLSTQAFPEICFLALPEDLRLLLSCHFGVWESLRYCFCPCLDLLVTLHSLEPLDSNNITTCLGFWSPPLPTLLSFFSLKINLLEVKCQQKRTYFL